MFEVIKNQWKKFQERCKRKRIAKEIETGKRPRGRTILLGSDPDSSLMASELKVRGSISARVIRKDGSIEDLGIISQVKEENNG